MLTSAEIRARARQSLRGNWTPAVLTMLLYVIIGFVLGLIAVIPVIGGLLEILLAGPLAYGLYVYYLETARNRSPSTATLFDGYRQYGRTFLLYLLVAIFTFLWTLLLVIPGIIAAFRYSQAYYILKDNPDIGALEAIRRSKEMMVGHKWRLFVLCLTFLGWYILGSIPFGIGLLWVIPYALTAVGHFHDDLKSRSLASPPPPPPGYGAPI